jgi:hypothetical protein
MQSISVLGLVAECVTAVKPGPVPERRLFQSVFLPRHNCWPGLLISVLLHGAGIIGLPRLMDLLPESEAQAWKRHMRAMRPLEIHIPDRLYLSSAAPEPLKPPKPRPKERQTPVPQEVAKAEIPPPAPSQAEPLRIPPRQFKLPQNVRKVDADQTLIQPHLPPDLTLTAKVRLPQLILLSGPALPKPVPRRFVEPGRSAAPAVAPRVDAPPQLASPSKANPDLWIASMLAGPENALLHLPRPTVPARNFQAPAPLPSGRAASVSPTLGEPINLLAISGNPAPLEERVTVPLGNQIGRLPNLPAYSDAAASASAGSAKPGSTGAPGGQGKSGSGSAGGDAAEQRQMAEFAKGLAALPLAYSTPIRIAHPIHTAYDVVVVQSGADQAFEESAGALTGQPIYTVYLQVGAPRAWILQYCMPREVAQVPQVAGGAVNIGSPAPVKAPFPLVTVLPPATMLPRTSYIFVHGFVDASGQLKDLAIMRAPNARIRELILPELLQWQFRPAVRDGAPVTVEILLAIPPQDV